MRLWSIQPLAVWEKLQKTATLNNNATYAQQDFLPAYRWMTAQMQQRIGPAPFKEALPFWAWFQAYGLKKAKPDLRRSGHLPGGRKGVRLQLEIPAEQVLLSDFELWHYVLNNWYLPISLADGELFERKRKKQWITEQKTVIQESWQRIFDLDFAVAEISDVYEKKSLQATFWELKLENVIDVQLFVAR